MIAIPPVSQLARCCGRNCECHNHNYFASISVARPGKRSFQQKEYLEEAGRSKKQRGEDRALQAAIDTLGVPAEGDSDRYQDSTNEVRTKAVKRSAGLPMRRIQTLMVN